MLEYSNGPMAAGTGTGLSSFSCRQSLMAEPHIEGAPRHILCSGGNLLAGRVTTIDQFSMVFKDGVAAAVLLATLVNVGDMALMLLGAFATAVAPFLISANGEYSPLVLVGCCFFSYSLVQGVRVTQRKAAESKAEREVDSKFKAYCETKLYAATVLDEEDATTDRERSDEETDTEQDENDADVTEDRNRDEATLETATDEAFALANAKPEERFEVKDRCGSEAAYDSEDEDVLTDLVPRAAESSLLMAAGSWADESEDLDEPRMTPEPIMVFDVPRRSSPPPRSASPRCSPPPRQVPCEQALPRSERPRAPPKLTSPGAMSRTSTSRTSTKLEEKQEYRQTSVAPVAALVFEAVGWDAQVHELCQGIASTRDGDEAVQQIVRAIERAVLPLLPGADVCGFVSGSVSRGLAFNVAVPEIDIILSAKPALLLDTVPRRYVDDMVRSKPKMVQKAAVRACVDVLTGEAGFKFRRSAFRADDPNVTLCASASICGIGKGVAFNFSINNATPMFCAALLTECERLDKRAKALVLLVRRWAKDRGISFVAKGHLSPYAWSLLSIYYLQVRQGALLPPLAGFPQCSKLAGLEHAVTTSEKLADASVADLFKGFMDFYTEDFKWDEEAVSVRLGRRAKPSTRLPLNVILGKGNVKVFTPAVDDPFTPGRNHAEAMTGSSHARMHHELARASWYCRQKASLSELLEPWVPPEQCAEEADGREGREGKKQPEEVYQ